MLKYFVNGRDSAVLGYGLCFIGLGLLLSAKMHLNEDTVSRLEANARLVS